MLYQDLFSINVINSFIENNEHLSNFYVHNIEVNGKVYARVEHAFQAFKTIDDDEHEKIRLAPTPGVAKKLGRKTNLRHD